MDCKNTKILALDEGAMKQHSEALSKILANEYLLYLLTLNFHWNITGKNFISIHELLEAQYESLKSTVDEVAERIRTLGFHAPGSYKKYQQEAIIGDGENCHDFDSMIQELSNSHSKVIKLIRDTIAVTDDSNDFATTDLLTRMLSDHEKQVWMLRSHLDNYEACDL